MPCYRMSWSHPLCSYLFTDNSLLLLQHTSTDFDQTWSQAPIGAWLQKLQTVWPQRLCRGHRGRKGHFYGKCYSSFMLHWILMKLGQKHQWVRGYKSYRPFDLKGHVGVTGVKNANYFLTSSDRAEIFTQRSLWHSKHPTFFEIHLRSLRGHKRVKRSHF